MLEGPKWRGSTEPETKSHRLPFFAQMVVFSVLSSIGISGRAAGP